MVKMSKFLSLVLRHKPEDIQLTLDSNGWVSIEQLIIQANKFDIPLSIDSLMEIIKTSDKKRFTVSDDSLFIRAAQGHSSEQVCVTYPKKTPPEFLYHGTAIINLDSIKQQGILPATRHHVHLSKDHETAFTVGSRHGKPIVLKINALSMHNDGFDFYLSENNVWLTKIVPERYLSQD